MASIKREKELARMRVERQATRRAAEAALRKQRRTVLASTLAVVLVAVAAGVIALQARGSGDPADPVAAPTDSAAPTPEPSAGPVVNPPGGCAYTPDGEAAEPVAALPPTTGVELAQPYTTTITSDRGVVLFETLTAQAPCTVNSFRTLSEQGWFDDTPCHRLTTSGISVLQCGDPGGTGAGGPGYSFPDEVTADATYPRGTVAMANAGPGTNGSQFFLVHQDSPLPPDYTVFGRITSGLDVLDAVAAGGATPEGDGAPNTPVQLQTVTTVPAA